MERIKLSFANETVKNQWNAGKEKQQPSNTVYSSIRATRDDFRNNLTQK